MNLQHIAQELRESYAQCQTDLERSIWRVIVKNDIRRLIGDRKLNPCEKAILDQYQIIM